MFCASVIATHPRTAGQRGAIASTMPRKVASKNT
jgi:hypothetical protein